MDKKQFIKRLQLRIPARWHMSLICLTTIAAGVLSSKVLLFFNLAEPMIRYGSAVLFSYVVFFVLIHFWLKLYFNRDKEKPSDDVMDGIEVVEIEDIGASRVGCDTASYEHGGNFSGGGARSSWEIRNEGVTSPGEESADSKEVLSLGDIDEGAIVILIIAAFAIVFGSAGFLIYQAPEILFEAAFEVVLAGGLLRQTKKMQSEGWHYSIFKRTWWLFALVLTVSMTFGFMMKKQCPDAFSFAQFRDLCWKQSKQ